MATLRAFYLSGKSQQEGRRGALTEEAKEFSFSHAVEHRRETLLSCFPLKSLSISQRFPSMVHKATERGMWMTSGIQEKG